jgi:hypothetical protein
MVFFWETNLPVYVLEDAGAVVENVKILGREKNHDFWFYDIAVQDIFEGF